ncbi:hypothetical protein AGMMS50225_01270 [Betaproteobacteria bacterium]|nr:hypothetical protein AGMMS50225_01270 [Betaproteobacteria bacterium]
MTIDFISLNTTGKGSGDLNTMGGTLPESGLERPARDYDNSFPLAPKAMTRIPALYRSAGDSMIRPLLALSLLLCALPLAAQPHPGGEAGELDAARGYPYMEKAWQAIDAQNWAEVETQMRELLEHLPHHEQGRVFLVEALARKGSYEEAEQAIALLTDTETAERLKNELQLIRIEQNPPASAPDFPGASRQQGWQTYNQYLQKSQGEAIAQNWRKTVHDRAAELELRQSQAKLAEKQQDWRSVIAALSPIEPEQLRREDWLRLGAAQVHEFNEDALKNLLAHAPDPAAATALRTLVIDHALARHDPDAARRWLDSTDTPFPHQRLELALLRKDAAQVERLAAQAGQPCLDTADWLSRHDPAAAQRYLQTCAPTENPKVWLKLAQQLKMGELLENTRLPSAFEPARLHALASIWLTKGRDDLALNALKRLPQTPSVLRQRAKIHSARGEWAQAAARWEEHYRLSDSTLALGHASQLALKQGQALHARELLETALIRHEGKLPAPLIARITDLSLRDDLPLEPQRASAILRYLAPPVREQLINRLADKGHCELVRTQRLSESGRCAVPAPAEPD